VQRVRITPDGAPDERGLIRWELELKPKEKLSATSLRFFALFRGDSLTLPRHSTLDLDFTSAWQLLRACLAESRP